MDEQRHVALPKLYGAPAYARPVVAVARTERPLDPDDLPLVAEMSEEDLGLLAPAPAPAPDAASHLRGAPDDPAASARAGFGLLPRAFSIRAFADRIRRARP